MLVVACGGGGGGGTNTIPGGPGATPTPVPTATPVPTPSPTPVPVGDSPAAATQLTDSPSIVVGDPTTIGIFPNTGTPTNATIDGIACGTSGTGQHFHAHVSVFHNGQQIVVPSGTGMYKPVVMAAPYFQDAGPGGCDYDLHIHSDDAILHIETVSPTQVFNIQELIDIWGQTLTANSFGPLAGPTRVFVTDESAGTPGSYTVREVTGQDLTMVNITRHLEITFEVGPTFVNVPNYTWNPPY